MLNIDLIVKNALLKLGELGTYNDTRSVIYKTSEGLLTDVVLPDTASDGALLFNATTIKLTKTNKKSVLDENQFNMPIDFLNLIRCIPIKSARVEGEYFYSREEEVIVQYMREIPLSEYPDYMRDYLILSLALRIAEVYNSYSDRVEGLKVEQSMARGQVEVVEGFEGAVDEKTYNYINPYIINGLDY